MLKRDLLERRGYLLDFEDDARMKNLYGALSPYTLSPVGLASTGF